MLKWCKNATYKNPSEVRPVIAQCKQLEGHSYQTLDTFFREEVNVVAMASFPQKKTEQTSLGNRQISYLESPLAISDIEYENNQYQTWIKNIKAVLQELKKKGIEMKKVPLSVWRKSVKIVLQDLKSKNSVLIEENRNKFEKIKLLSGQREEIENETSEIIQRISNFFLLESQVDVLDLEEEPFQSTRRISVESGYHSYAGSDISNRSSMDSFSDEIEEERLQSPNYQKLIKKNRTYKTWINVVEGHFGSAPELFDLKNLSFQEVELIEKDKEQDKKIQLLEKQLIKAKEDHFALRKDDHALQQADLWRDIHQYQFLNQLEIEEENAYEIQIELEGIEKDINTLQERVTGLNAPIEKFTICLEQNKNLISLLKT